MAEKSNEWFTPAKYVEAAREVMGGIDLDPASCELANQTVKATRYYSKEDDGLSKPWYGRVWLNPPFGRINGKPGSTKAWPQQFMNKLLNEPIEQAIVLLLGSAPFKAWFQPLWNYPICIQKSSEGFLMPDGHLHYFGFGICFVYLGPNEQKFIDTFSQFGRIAKAIDTPRHVEKPIPLWDAELSAAQVANHFQVGSLGV